jgi:hypothetical protein
MDPEKIKYAQQLTECIRFPDKVGDGYQSKLDTFIYQIPEDTKDRRDFSGLKNFKGGEAFFRIEDKFIKLLVPRYQFLIEKLLHQRGYIIIDHIQFKRDELLIDILEL